MALEAFINGDKLKADKKRRRTLRFELELARPTEETTNEFSFTELVERAQRKVTFCLGALKTAVMSGNVPGRSNSRCRPCVKAL